MRAATVHWGALCFGWGLAGCATDPSKLLPTDSTFSEPAVSELDAPRLARRISLDLRGIPPSLDELDRVDADSGELGVLVDEWLADPLFEERVVELYSEKWRTEVDAFLASHWEFGLDDSQQYRFLRSVGQEPLRIIARVAAQDLPYTTIVTADWTMADEMLQDLFPVVPTEPAESGWTVAQYTDGRPAAGVLVTNGLWWRYDSPLFNYSRRRTAAILDLLVCDDLLVRPVVFNSPELAESADTQAAVRSNPDCLTCHATIEPIAATLFGFQPADNYSASELTVYHPEREASGPGTLHVDAAWAGQPVDGLAGLGHAIAADTRFVDCAVETLAEGMLRRELSSADIPLARTVRDRFVEADLSVKEALRAILEQPTYRAGGLSADASDHLLDHTTTRRLLGGPQLRRSLEAVAGLHWERDGAVELDNDYSGYRVMAGGMDGEAVSEPLQAPGTTYVAVTRRAAQAAARTWLDAHLDGSRPSAAFADCSPVSTPDDTCFRELLATLAWQLHAVHASDARLDAWTTLWWAAHDLSADPTEAHAVVLSAMLRDPAFLTY